MGIDKYTNQKILDFSEIKMRIKENGIEMIRLEYVDLLGITRAKLLPVSMVDEMFDDGIAFCAASYGMSYDNSIIGSGFLAETCDDMLVKPDPSTFTILSHYPKTAMIIGDLYYNDEPFCMSPRTFLKSIVDKYHEMGMEPIAASELEFFVYNKMEDGSLQPYTNKTCNCYTANHRTDPKQFLYKLTKTFADMQFNVLYMNHEYFPGQYEYNWKHANVVRAADESALFKSLTKEIADMNDMMVTFMAKPKTASGGSGCHFHLSLNDVKTGKNICDDPTAEDGISETMRHMIGGIMKHAKSMTAFLAPTVNCYKRYQPNSFAPIYIGWGHDNRTTYIRIPKERGKATRLEVRAGSAACNSYLALGSILAAGLDGIINKIEPPEKIVTDLYNDEESQKRVDCVPRSLFQAVKNLQDDSWFTEEINKELVDIYCNMKMHEIESYKKFVTDWEWDTYAYHI